ncbi:MAG: VCBS repeat-containing protein, partial [Planctomycetes bacterium]|nr:VCBS repeat-containing protein [Planctomycetota bacterium]
MPSAARPFHLAALLLGAAFALPARAEEPRSQVQAPRLPVLFTACEASAPEAPVFVGRSNGLRAHFHRDRIELLREDERARAKVALRFVGTATTPESAELAPGKVNYLLGEPSQWRRNVALHAALRYRALWPGVDLVVHGRAGELQYDLHFAPGIDLEAVALRVEGASAVRVNEAGALVMSTPLGELVQQAPLTWEVRADGQREVVPSAFALREDGSYGFRVQRVDASRPLVVDPILVWGTYLGAAGGGESASAIHVDDSGAIYIAGTVAGVTGYETPGAYRTTTNAGPSDGFLAKLDPSQTGAAQVVWFTLMGGSQSDTIQAMVRRPSGTLVASGRTTINEGSTLNGLLTPNAYSTSGDCFLIELSADGSSVLYGTRCSFLANDLKLEPSGVLLIGMDVLQFSSPTAPTTPGAFQASKSGPDDIWLGRFDNRLSGSAQLLWGSYFGGSGSESLSHVMPSKTEPGVFTFAGITNDATTFPSTHSSGPLGSNDVFLARMDTNQVGSAQRRFAHVCGRRFLVGGESDLCGGFVEEPDGTIWLASVNEWSQLRHFSSDGATLLELWDWTFTGGFGGFHGELFRSDDGILTMVALSDFIPVTPDAVQSTIRGRDLGVVQLDPVAHQVLYGTRLGSVNADGYTTGACHLRGNVLTLALTIYEGAMPILNPLQPAHSGGGCCNHTDLYLARLELPFGQSATPGIGPRDLALLDLDGDGHLDAATANETSNNLSLRTNEGLGVFSAETTLALTASDSAPVALTRADLDNDGARDDLAVACEASSTLVLVTNPGAASPTLVSRATGGSRASCVASGDLDGNPQDDVVVGREGLPLAGGGGLALSLNGGALVSLTIPAPQPTQVVAVALGDLDGDGDADLAAVARGASDALLLFAGDGAGALSFAAALPLSTSGSASGLVLADLDRDGRNDLAVAQPVLFPPSQS